MGKGRFMSRVKASHAADAGFSMVEALVALAVFALAGVGLVQLQAQSLRTLSIAEGRALADMVAQNALVDAAARLEAPVLGAGETEIENAGRDWTLRTIVAPTPDAAIRRISVEVRRNGEEGIVARAHSFVGSPRQLAMPSLQEAAAP